MKREVALLLGLSFGVLAGSDWRREFTARARTYLDPSVLPRPATSDGEPGPDFSGNRFSWMRCWGVRDGVVCSACYDNGERYLAQSAVVCPWSGRGCRWTYAADEWRRWGISIDQCIKD